MLPDPDSPIRTPRQDRSRASMARILDAAARTLESRTFEELTVANVTREAGTSVGAFYARFQDKDALLLALVERFFEDFERQFHTLIRQPGWARQPISAIMHDLVELMLTTYGRNQGVLRALHLKALMHTDGPFREREQSLWVGMFPVIREILMEHRQEIAHPDPNLAVRLGLQQLVFGIHEIYLWGAVQDGRLPGIDEICAELTRAFLAYLEVKED